MGNHSRPTPSQLLLSLFAMDQSQVEQFVNAAITKNNELTLLGSMKSILDSSLSDIKRANSDAADSHLPEIKKLKFEEPRRFKKKANEDQYRFNSKLTDVLDEAKSSCSTQNLDKVKESLEKGETNQIMAGWSYKNIKITILLKTPTMRGRLLEQRREREPSRIHRKLSQESLLQDGSFLRTNQSRPFLIPMSVLL